MVKFDIFVKKVITICNHQSYLRMAAKKFCHDGDVVKNDFIGYLQCYWFLKSIHMNNLFQITFSNIILTKLKNVKAKPEKLVLMKHDPVVNKHVLFKEERIKKG